MFTIVTGVEVKIGSMLDALGKMVNGHKHTTNVTFLVYMKKVNNAVTLTNFSDIDNFNGMALLEPGIGSPDGAT